jgi:hypothetical protein
LIFAENKAASTAFGPKTFLFKTAFGALHMYLGDFLHYLYKLGSFLLSLLDTAAVVIPTDDPTPSLDGKFNPLQ